MIELILMINLNLPPNLAIASPTEVAQEMVTNVQNGFNWVQEYILAIIGLTLGTSLLGFWLKTWR